MRFIFSFNFFFFCLELHKVTADLLGRSSLLRKGLGRGNQTTRLGPTIEASMIFIAFVLV